MGLLSKTVAAVKRNGFVGVLQRVPPYLYREFIRKSLPRKKRATYSSVKVDAWIRIGERLLNSRLWLHPGYDREQYEAGIVEGIEKYVESGDDVVVVGGGWGVSTIKAAQKAGDDGTVVTFEAAKTQVKKIRNAIQVNDIAASIEVKENSVGEVIDVWDETTNEALDPTDLPPCDVLVLDCEGAEVGIIESMDIKPRAIIVETHGHFGSEKENVCGLLKKSGYQVKKEMVADTEIKEQCKEKGIYVLWADAE